MKFSEWLKIKTEMAGTGVVYDPKVKPKTFQWWGAPGGTGNLSVKGYPIGTKKDKSTKRAK